MSKRLLFVLAFGLCAPVIAAPAAAKNKRVIGGHATVTPSSDTWGS